jgi:glycine betaine/proline transport system permease protein/glycine betaine/proline transport system substrate-binding protein
MNKNLFKVFLLLIVGASLFAMPNSAFAKTEIIVADNGWDSQKLHNEIAKIVIESIYDDYILKTSTAASHMNWQAIIAGDVDLDLESWTENILSYPKDVENGDIINVGVITDETKQGYYVPRYVVEGDPKRGIKPMAPDLKTVKDLLKYSKLFPDKEDKKKGIVHGTLPGWRSDEILYKKHKLYGLDKFYNYRRSGSEAALFGSLVSAYNLGEAWVGYCFEPTWVTGKLDLILLEDEPYDKDLYKKGACAFPFQELKIVSGRYFAKKAPDLLEFLGKYRTSSKLISQALAYLDDNKATHKDTAVWFLKTNDYLLDEWLPQKQADRVRAVLQDMK